MKLIKLSFAALLLSLISINSASAQAFGEGNHFFSVGYGYSAFKPSSIAPTGVDGLTSSNLGPITVQYEMAVGEKFGIGLDVGYSLGKLSYDVIYNDENFNTVTGATTYEKSKLTINLRGTSHFGSHDMIDPYLAYGIGYRMVNRTWASDDPNYIALETEALLPVSMLLRFGARIMFSENVGAFVETGFGHGVFQGGLNVKL